MNSRRYFVRIAYRGSSFHGFQRQVNALTVQELLENRLSTYLRDKITVTGCGRTDAGVHARTFYFHFDFEGTLPDNFQYRMNQFLPRQIAIYELLPVSADSHARFDATERAYEYHIHSFKDPFDEGLSWYFPRFHQLDLTKLEQAAALLLEFEAFYPFCKSDTDVHTMNCRLLESTWHVMPGDYPRLEYHVRANRFLRGMVRLIVGMCLNVSLGKLSLSDVRASLENQISLDKSWSVPPDGLFLTDVVYPFLSRKN